MAWWSAARLVRAAGESADPAGAVQGRRGHGRRAAGLTAPHAAPWSPGGVPQRPPWWTSTDCRTPEHQLVRPSDQTRGAARPGVRHGFRAMGVVLATTFGLIIWLVLWAIGAKAFDAFMITVLIALHRRDAADARRTCRATGAPERPSGRRRAPPEAREFIQG